MAEKIKNNRWYLIMAACAILCLGAFLFMLTGLKQTERFTVPVAESGAVDGAVPALTSELCYTVLDEGQMPFSVGVCARPVRNPEGLSVWFTNPEGSESWLLLKAYDSRGNLLGQTGTLEPGQYVESIAGDFSGADEVTLQVLAYEPYLYYSNGTVTLDVSVN